MDRAEQRYSMTLPSGMQVEVFVAGLSTMLKANELYEHNKANYCSYEHCLVFASLQYINGEPAADILPDAILPAKDFNTLSMIVQQIVIPTQQELNAAIASVKLLPPTDTVTADAPSPIA